MVFKYALKNAFSQTIKALYIDESDNLHLLGEDDKEEKVIRINTDKVKEILEKYEDVYKSVYKEDLPVAGVLDGYVNEFSFQVNNHKYKESICNLCYFNDEQIDNSKHLTTIIDLLDELYDELLKQNKIIEEYFIIAQE